MPIVLSVGEIAEIATMLLLPFPSYDLGFPRGGTWHVRFNGDWNGYSSDFASTPSNDTMAYDGRRDGLGYHGTVGVGAFSVVVLSQ